MLLLINVTVGRTYESFLVLLSEFLSKNKQLEQPLPFTLEKRAPPKSNTKKATLSEVETWIAKIYEFDAVDYQIRILLKLIASK